MKNAQRGALKPPSGEDLIRRRKRSGRTARTLAREILREVLEEWQPCHFFGDLPHVQITSFGGVDIDCDLDALQRELRPEHYALVDELLGQLFVQCQVANFAMVLVDSELSVQQQRVAGGALGAQRRRKDTRQAVEKRMRAILREGKNPLDFLPELSGQYDYRVRHLRNILRDVLNANPILNS